MSSEILQFWSNQTWIIILYSEIIFKFIYFFPLDDLLATKGATAIRPPFLKGKPHLDIVNEQRGKIIAAARVHVERYNQRIKNWKFIGDHDIPQISFPCISQAIYVICHFANLTPMILKK